MTCDWRATTSRAVSSNSRDRPPATQSRHLDFAEIRKSNHPEFHFVGLQLRRCHRSVMGPVARSFTPPYFLWSRGRVLSVRELKRNSA